MKKILLFAVLGLLIQSSFAQDVNYRFRKDDALGDNLWLVFDPIYMDVYYADMNWGWAGEANLRVKKAFSIAAIYRQPYKGKATTSEFLPYNHWRYLSNNNGDLATTNDLKKFQYFEGNISFHLSDKVRNYPTKVILHQISSTNYWTGTKLTYTESIHVPASTRTTTSLRIGYIASRTPLRAKNVGKDKITFKDRSGNDIQLNENSFTMMDYYALYGGISETDDRNFQIAAEGYGDKGDHSYSCLYADFIYAPYIHLDDFALDLTK